jgi:LysM repeat protein
MPISHTSPYRRHVFGTVAICLTSAALIAAWQQGWLVRDVGPDPFAAGNSVVADADVPPPDDELVEMPPEEMPSEIAVAQAEAESPELESELTPAAAPVPRKKNSRSSQWASASPSRFDRDDGIGDGESVGRKSRTKSRVVTAGFEDDEAPPVPDVAGDKEPSVPEPQKPTKEAIARKSSDSTTGASPPQTIDPDQPKRPTLVNGDKIQALIDEGSYIEAQKELSQWYWQKPAEREQIMPQLNKLARALYFAPQPQYYDAYVVKPGDQLRVVGQRFKLSWEYIAKLNNVDAKKIRMGQKLKVVPGPFAVIVFLDRYELVVHLNGSFVKSYRVGVGKDGTTPVGTFAVKNKMVNPTYYGPEGVIAGDDPKNPLGERWIDIGDSYGIHGTIEPESIGKKESRGCIRMLNSEVEEVYDFLVIGSEVKIVRK